MKCNRIKFNYIDDDDLLNEFPRIRKKGKQTINIRFPEKLLNVLQWLDNTRLFLKIKWDENKNKGLFIAQNLQFGNILTLSSGRINIPIALARDLGLEHKDNIIIVIKEIDGQKGLFLWKREEK